MGTSSPGWTNYKNVWFGTAPTSGNHGFCYEVHKQASIDAEDSCQHHTYNLYVLFCLFLHVRHIAYNFFTSSEGIPVTPYAVSFAREYEIVLEEPILVNYDKTIFFDIKISGDSYYREIDAEYTGSGYSWDERATRYFAKHLFPEGGQELSVVLYEDGTSLKMRMKRFYNSVRTPYLTYSVPDNFTAKMKGDRIKIAYDGDVELRNVRIILENW